MAEEIKSINYTPEEYTEEILENNIPGLGTQPLDSGISIRGKIFTDIITVPASGGYVVSNIPFKPSHIDFFATLPSGEAWSMGKHILGGAQSSMARNNALGTRAFTRGTIGYIFLDDGTNTWLSSGLIYTNNGFKIQGGGSSSTNIQYTAYA